MRKPVQVARTLSKQQGTRRREEGQSRQFLKGKAAEEIVQYESEFQITAVSRTRRRGSGRAISRCKATETAAGDKPSPKNSQNKKVEREQARTERRADNKVENRRIVEQEKQDRQEAKKLEALNIKLLRKKVGIILEPTAEWSSKRAK